MKLHVVTPKQNVLETEAEEVILPSAQGPMGILPGHAHYVGQLATGALYYQRGGKKEALVVSGGFLEILDDQISVLADSAQLGSQINREAVRQELESLEARLVSGTVSLEEYPAVLAQRELEQARLAAAL